MFSTFLHEPELLAFAYDLEQEIQPRRVPQYSGKIPAEPKDAGLCDSNQPQLPRVTGKHRLLRHLGTNKLIPGR
jgi:hypothetical protein